MRIAVLAPRIAHRHAAPRGGARPARRPGERSLDPGDVPAAVLRAAGGQAGPVHRDPRRPAERGVLGGCGGPARALVRRRSDAARSLGAGRARRRRDGTVRGPRARDRRSRALRAGGVARNERHPRDLPGGGPLERAPARGARDGAVPGDRSPPVAGEHHSRRGSLLVAARTDRRRGGDVPRADHPGRTALLLLGAAPLLPRLVARRPRRPGKGEDLGESPRRHGPRPALPAQRRAGALARRRAAPSRGKARRRRHLARRSARRSAILRAAAPVDEPGALAHLAALRLAQGKPTEALAAADEGVARSRAMGLCSTFTRGAFLRAVHLECVLAAGDHGAASAASAKAREHVLADAGRIPDAECRGSFLESVPENRRILELARHSAGENG